MLDDWLCGDEDLANEVRELKVRLPLELHVRMHGLKLLHDRTLSDTVEEALWFYFAAMARGEVKPGRVVRRTEAADQTAIPEPKKGP